MERINEDSNLRMRYQRLRKVIEGLERREQQYSDKVLEKFETMDMEGIEMLARQRQKNQQLRARLERFLDYYERKKW